MQDNVGKAKLVQAVKLRLGKQGKAGKAGLGK